MAQNEPGLARSDMERFEPTATKTGAPRATRISGIWRENRQKIASKVPVNLLLQSLRFEMSAAANTTSNNNNVAAIAEAKAEDHQPNVNDSGVGGEDGRAPEPQDDMDESAAVIEQPRGQGAQGSPIGGGVGPSKRSHTPRPDDVDVAAKRPSPARPDAAERRQQEFADCADIMHEFLSLFPNMSQETKDNMVKAMRGQTSTEVAAVVEKLKASQVELEQAKKELKEEKKAREEEKKKNEEAMMVKDAVIAAKEKRIAELEKEVEELKKKIDEEKKKVTGLLWDLDDLRRKMVENGTEVLLQRIENLKFEINEILKASRNNMDLMLRRTKMMTIPASILFSVTRNLVDTHRDVFQTGVSFSPDLHAPTRNWLQDVLIGQPHMARRPTPPLPAAGFPAATCVELSDWADFIRVHIRVRGAPNTSRIQLARDFLADIAASTWQQVGAKKFIKDRLYKITGRSCSVGFWALNNMIEMSEKQMKEYAGIVIGEDGVMRMLGNILSLAVEAENFPKVVPLLTGDVKSITFDYQQTGTILAMMLLNKDCNWFNLKDPNAAIRLRFLSDFFEYVKHHGVPHLVSYKLNNINSNDFRILWNRRKDEQLGEIEVHGSIDESRVRLASKIIGCSPVVGENFHLGSRSIGREQLYFLELIQDFIVSMLHPKLAGVETLSIVGSYQFSTHVTGSSPPQFRPLNHITGAGPGDRLIDGVERCASECILFSPKSSGSSLSCQLGTIREDLAMLLASLDAQCPGIARVPICAGSIHMEEGRNQQLMILLLIVGAGISGRRLLMHTNGDDTLAENAIKLVERMKKRRTTLKQLVGLLGDERSEPNIDATGLFNWINEQFDEEDKAAKTPAAAAAAAQ